MEKDISNVLLGIAGHSDRFLLRFGWFRFRMKISPISTNRNIKISGELCQISEFEEDGLTYFQALMKYAKDARYINRAIAIATGTRFVKIVAHMISKLPNKDQNTLFKIVIKNADPEVFFYTMVLARKMNLLKKKKE